MNSDTESEIQKLRRDLQLNGKLSMNADNVVATALVNASLARRLRELRGHADLFKPTPLTPATQIK